MISVLRDARRVVTTPPLQTVVSQRDPSAAGTAESSDEPPETNLVPEALPDNDTEIRDINGIMNYRSLGNWMPDGCQVRGPWHPIPNALGSPPRALGQPPDLGDQDTANLIPQLVTVFPDGPPNPDQSPQRFRNANQDWLSTREARRVAPYNETRQGINANLAALGITPGTPAPNTMADWYASRDSSDAQIIPTDVEESMDPGSPLSPQTGPDQQLADRSQSPPPALDSLPTLMTPRRQTGYYS